MVDARIAAYSEPEPLALVPDLPVYAVDQLPAYTETFWGGDKWAGSFGNTWLMDDMDYETLRLRSIQMFRTNKYGRGIIRRLLTNEINTGLIPEATPDASIIGLDEDAIAAWAEDAERRFTIWGELPQMCDNQQLRTFGELQELCRETALTSGDALVVMRIGPTGLPTVEIIDGMHISSPMGKEGAQRNGNEINRGVETDKRGRHLAFHVEQDDGTHQRITSRASRTGRLQAWMVYGTERRVDDVRGEPILSILLQSMRDLDRYEDSELRSALANAMIALWVEKTDDGPGTRPLSGGAKKRGSITAVNDDGTTKVTPVNSHIPGVSMEALGKGEKLHSFDSRRPNVNHANYVATVQSAMAMALEMPPEVFQLQFQSSFSAARMANSEFNMYLEKSRGKRSNELGKPIWREWMVGMALNGDIVAPGFLDAWRDTRQWQIFGAWTQTDWSGQIKPGVDHLKDVKAVKEAIAEGLMTRDGGSKRLYGKKFTRIAPQLRRENILFADAMAPLQPSEQSAMVGGANNVPSGQAATEALLDEHTDRVIEAIEQYGG
ncbi:MAG: phage portal protein [Gammaproteobacteria bacterium]|nr:phage portal protein [Gammaproteobacteria bacterium]